MESGIKKAHFFTRGVCLLFRYTQCVINRWNVSCTGSSNQTLSVLSGTDRRTHTW